MGVYMTNLLLAIIYLAFISLGLPDGLLGAAWPTVYQQMNVPVSYAGIISTIIAIGTIVSSLASDALTKRLGAGRITALSVGLTAAALFGFSRCNSFLPLCFLAIPYGLGAGSVDAALNNYVALHYESRHMSWLHCCWGIGASTGPYIMGYALAGGMGWHRGYEYVALIQIILTAALFLSLPLWKKHVAQPGQTGEKSGRALSLREIFAIDGAKEVMLFFFGYCAVEQTMGLWAGSYLAVYRGLSEELAASLASMFFLGITIGRGACGFITMKLRDTAMIRLGLAVIAFGILVMLLPFGTAASIAGIVLVGLGCAPVYPCIIHSTPEHFGAERSQAIIGVQMASAYTGILLMPPLFGIIARNISMALLPLYALAILLMMYFMHERLVKITDKGALK